ncbi:M14 family metallopeptidase [Lutibacter sp.]|uniref:M14 family metallopeptidase n=1 Tax=Lutibacter sp. TaxID=1925666 RepID=UPI00273436D2|nr:M14 family metallopeptidase [Lutibacter sp.]MDP3314000.1 M14 family metallopeptidase [Lutibacter sp.]
MTVSKIYNSFNFVFLALALITTTQCSLPNNTFVKPIIAEDSTNTDNKKITLQEKKIFFDQNTAIYLSNNFDGARLNDVKKLNDSTLQLRIQPENTPINNSAYFAFKIWSKKPTTAYLEFNYPKDYSHRYIPKIKSENEIWQNIDSNLIFKKDTIITIKVIINEKPQIIAAQEIITSTQTKIWYNALIQQHKAKITYKTIGNSVLGKPIPMLDIHTGNENEKDIVVLLARQHPPEITGFMAFQSFLQNVLESNQITADFFTKYRVLVFPIVNPDGVDLGHWRHNANGIDLNRDWSFYKQPEINAITKAIVQVANKSKGKVVIGIDFHSTQEDLYYTSHSTENSTIPHFYDEWFKAIDDTFPNYKPNEIREDSNQPVSKAWFLGMYGATAITYEIGDETPRDFVREKGKVAAIEMMKILNKR